jgi:transcriptional regulator with XRE-family HTH domain
MEASAALAPRARARPVTPVGRRLAAVMQERGLTLHDLAAKAGVSVSQLSLLTRGRISHPRSNTLEKIALALGMPESALLGTDQRRPDLRAGEGVLSVPFMEVGPEGELEGTGFSFPVAAAELAGRRRVFAAEVDCGMPPHVLTGDRVLVDPDADPAPGQMILGSYRRSTRVALLADRDGGMGYWVEGEGVWLDRGAMRCLGAVVYIMRRPPGFHGP